MPKRMGLKKEVMEVLKDVFGDGEPFRTEDIMTLLPNAKRQSLHALFYNLIKEKAVARIAVGVYTTKVGRPEEEMLKDLERAERQKTKQPKEPSLSYEQIGKAIEARIKKLEATIRERDEQIANLQSQLNNLQTRYNDMKMKDHKSGVTFHSIGLQP